MNNEQIIKKLLTIHNETQSLSESIRIFEEKHKIKLSFKNKESFKASLKWRDICNEALHLLKSKKAKTIREAVKIISQNNNEEINQRMMMRHAKKLNINLNLKGHGVSSPKTEFEQKSKISDEVETTNSSLWLTAFAGGYKKAS